MLEDEFGDVIGKARRGLGLTTAELARLTGVPEVEIERFEAYKADPTDAQVVALAQVLTLRPEPLRELARKAWQPEPAVLAWPGWEVHAMTLRDSTGFTSNTYLLWNLPGGEVLIVDPGFEPGTVRKAVTTLGLSPRYVAVTHGHHDHVGAAREIADHYQIPALIGEQDLELVPGRDRGALTKVREGQRFALGSGEFRVLDAPGHTAGGRCYLVPGACFVGDTLFAASIGRTFGGPPDYPIHLATIRGKVLALPPETRLFPGHGPPTTVGEEREHNPVA